MHSFSLYIRLFQLCTEFGSATPAPTKGCVPAKVSGNSAHLATQADAEAHHDEIVASMGVSEVCKLADGQIEGSGHGGKIGAWNQDGYGCSIECSGESTCVCACMNACWQVYVFLIVCSKCAMTLCKTMCVCRPPIYQSKKVVTQNLPNRVVPSLCEKMQMYARLIPCLPAHMSALPPACTHLRTQTYAHTRTNAQYHPEIGGQPGKCIQGRQIGSTSWRDPRVHIFTLNALW